MIDEANIGAYLKALSKEKDGLRHENYRKMVEHADHMCVHINGKHPKKLLDSRRPNEPEEIKKYREEIYVPITKSKSKKVINVLARINNSKNYSIKFGDSEKELENYIYKDYPYYGSYITWVFDVALKQSLADPNAVIVFMPDNLEEIAENDTVYAKPFGQIIPSERVLDFKMDEYYTILSKEKSLVSFGQGMQRKGFIYHIFTPTEVIEYRQYGKYLEFTFQKNVLWVHNMGEIPVVTLGGEYCDGSWPMMYESFMAGVLPYWDDAIRQFSDKQAVFVQHVYLERVEMQVECDGMGCGQNGAEPGYVCGDDGETKMTCKKCQGAGWISGRSPYGVTSVKKQNLSPDLQQIFPGVQYVDKPVDIVKLLKEDITELVNDGFSALNMDFLAEAPLNESGKAKEYDRAELTSYLTSVSNNLFDNIIYFGIKYITLGIYGISDGIEKALKRMPVINKPNDFDIISLNQIISDFTNRSNLPPEIRDAIQLDIIDKKFTGDEMKRQLNRAIIELDPLRGKTSDEKFTAFSNNVISKDDYIVSENIRKYLMLATEGDPKFFEKTFSEKMDILYEIADTQIVEEQKKELYDPEADPGKTEDNPE